jgi:hypothetical protein
VYPDDDVTPEIDEDGDEGDIASGGAPERPDRQ